MKTTKLLLGIALPAMMLASCDSDTGELKFTTELNAINLTTPINSDAPSTASQAKYAVELDFQNNVAQFACTSLVYGSEKDATFTNQLTPFTITGNGFTNYRLSPSNTTIANTSTAVTDQKYIVSNAAYWASPLYPGEPVLNYNNGFRLIGSYNLGDNFKVVTLQPDAFYSGVTETNTGYRDEKMYYRVVLDVEKSKANMYIYEAKFAENMPVSIATMKLADLDIVYTNGSYSVVGQDVVPMVYDQQGETPYDRFIFNSVEMTVSGDFLTNATIKYQVAGKYEGTFTGRYANI